MQYYPSLITHRDAEMDMKDYECNQICRKEMERAEEEREEHDGGAGTGIKTNRTDKRGRSTEKTGEFGDGRFSRR